MTAIFFDRDDTLNRCNLNGFWYITTPTQMELVGGVAEGLSSLKEADHTLYVVTNQNCISDKTITSVELAGIHHKLNELTDNMIDAIMVNSGQGGHVEKAMAKAKSIRVTCALDGFRPEDSWMIGDQVSDISAGIVAGCKTIHLWYPPTFIHAGPETRDMVLDMRGKKPDTSADFEAASFEEVVEIVKDNTS